jgi:hypothetical protein
MRCCCPIQALDAFFAMAHVFVTMKQLPLPPQRVLYERGSEEYLELWELRPRPSCDA